jgi:Flp pilus assembly protein TadD
MRSLLPLLLLASPAFAEGIAFRPLPAEWRGFLSDLRTLRNAANPAPGPNPLRETLAARAAALEAKAKAGRLSADDAADLGECHVRLGEPLKAVAVLRAARTADPKDYRVTAGLGVAWVAAGDWNQAAASFDDAVEVAPAAWKDVDAAHRTLARARAREGKDADGLDDLFGVTFVGASGKPEAGTIAAAERKKLPANAVAVVQHLLTRSPADARLLWLLGELANATGDVRTAANILDGCVGDFGLKSADARARRKVYRAAADAREKADDHAANRGTQTFKSPRLFAKLTDEARLPKIDPDGVNRLPWAALGDTTTGPKLAPKFLKHVEGLDGKTVELVGFMRPFADGAADEFVLTEYPIGCWFCDQPGPLQVAVIELGEGKRTDYVPGAVVVVGTLALNRTAPERYLFTVAGSRVKRPD